MRHPTQAAKKTATCLQCGHRCRGRYDQKVLRIRDLSVAGWRIYLEFKRWRVHCPRCHGVHVEHLDWLAKNPRYTQRFARHVGRLCRDMPNQRVAEMERLHHSTVKALDTLYMQKQIELAGQPAPRAIGIDEIAIRKGHNYRVIVSDLERGRPIWVGGQGRKEADIDLFFQAVGEKKSARIELAAMDMWKAFRNSVRKNAPRARIIFDKFHIMRHLSKALDEVRRREYKRLTGKDRRYIKGQRYTLLSRRENLNLDGRPALKKLLQANRRLNTACVLKERFGQLWDYRTERGARAFFERWKDSLKWQRLEPYRKFAELIEAHWEGIASYCHPDNKVSLGLVEGINNKIRVLQRRAYGYRDEDYLKLKIVAAFLPPLPRNADINPHKTA
ncbi:MAG: ISL3 family transposase [Candidatus Latescibacteria bacterium]|nr:ISL3 family transposase [Candidatus Latescibacterota bacterium]